MAWNAPSADESAGDPPERLRLMRWVAVATFGLGGLTCASGIWITAASPVSRASHAQCAAAFVACSVLLALLRPRRWVLQLSAAASILILGVLVARTDPLGMTPLFFLWPVVFAAYFFSARFVAAMYVWAATSLGVGLLVNSHLPLKVDAFVGTLSSVGLMAGLVVVMTRREGDLRGELARAAETDSLTGLFNRRAFDPRFGEMIGSATSSSSPLSVVIFDVDHFKQLNDDHGHLVGDDVLRVIASVLTGESRRGDAVGRLGGEEFAVALPGTDLDAARSYAERVARKLRSGCEHLGLQVSVSAGLATHEAGGDAHSMMLRADEALYAAKNAGRARVAWWDGDVVVGEPHETTCGY